MQGILPLPLLVKIKYVPEKHPRNRKFKFSDESKYDYWVKNKIIQVLYTSFLTNIVDQTKILQNSSLKGMRCLRSFVFVVMNLAK